jgi:hypothetical protein
LKIWYAAATAVSLKLGAVAPRGAVKLKSRSHKIFKYLKKNICYITDSLKKLNKLVIKSTNQWYR